MKKLLALIFAATVAIFISSCNYCYDCNLSDCELYNSSTLAIENNLDVPVYITIEWNSCEPTELDYSQTMNMSVIEYKVDYITTPVCSGSMVVSAEGYTFIPELKTIGTSMCKTTKYQINPDLVNPGVAIISAGAVY